MLLLYASAFFVVVLIPAILITLLVESSPSIKAFGLKFLWTNVWDPITLKFGALPFLVGTLLTSILAILISFPFSFSTSILLGEFIPTGWLAFLFSSMIELLAGVPSVIYGFWGLFVVVPWVRHLELKLNVLPYGVGVFTASLILAMMILPYSASIGREVLRLVPQEVKEAAYSLGATRYEVVKRVVLPYAFSGISAGILLAFGRALGETMAVTMVIGNANVVPKSLFAPGNTLASVIANEFTEAAGKLHLSSLMELGLVLFFVTVFVNFIGEKVIKKLAVAK